ncbi:hypothetical protein HBI56_058480 [Parastagonospora nodorum]|uniref:Uncharacterized protein n=1 Tax=Phaeosphaeria nodorum (strain SN15 / ATCC MYA-4574 / FGSC 10173) TaxID=321614 RepID=A0A7U2F1Z3_PHANO|nr:hypothetical protein HBH56_160160 [Parastagonospora nodorum]QRC97240.1 hypothetical protein JI435_410310 [Parastagonospora nodorum SN15]KAH3922391.1 hypothetical protein HBH54_224590 [Parastagonospora nodorum]KAH3947117.1 hypothetical protein HBH53_121750 [Parastagonospora nodorum]KAH3969541.1 hypothetical protein HBH52_169760 [Parastagonospora nodorum]
MDSHGEMDEMRLGEPGMVRVGHEASVVINTRIEGRRVLRASLELYCVTFAQMVMVDRVGGAEELKR